MTAERWQQVKAILDAAHDVQACDRPLFLSESCAGDEDLRREVESLLEHDADVEEFIEQPAFARPAWPFEETETAGRRIGQYSVEREIGRGGMGVVYLATRTNDYTKRVAIKVIKRGMDTDFVLRRFRTERQILASLQHPNIAGLLDGGTTEDGLPYFVMEYVEGETIIEYAATKDLSLEKRLDLFREVCAAVSYAHQNLVIHRDLKPANILVNSEGVPKLLDFGIAKLLNTEVAGQTATQHLAFTPEYASPEQVCGEKLATATDIYSLGVILYELLTGGRPFSFEDKNFGQIVQAVTQNDPPKPSDTGRRLGVSQLKGDLDTIILKSLKRDKERRYSSVEQFSADIRRHLDGLPVTARPDTFIYRTAKFTGRNKVGVTAAAIVLATLVAGVFATLRQAQIAEVERFRAERRAENLRELSNSLIAEIHNEIEHLPGSLPARQLLLRRGVEQLDALAIDTGENLDLQNEVARAYFSVGNMQQAAGSVESALESHGKAVGIYKNLTIAEPGNVNFRAHLAEGLANIGGIQKIRGGTTDSLNSYRQAVELLETVVADDPNTPLYRYNLWNAYYGEAIALYILGNVNESLAASRRSLVLGEELRRLEPANPDYAGTPGISRNMIAINMDYGGDYESAIDEYRRLIAENIAEHNRQPDNTRYRFSLFAYHRRLALSLRNSGQTYDALTAARMSLKFISDLARDGASDAGHQRHKSIAHLLVGQILMARDDEEGALNQFQNSVDISERLQTADPNNGETKSDLALIYSNFGNSLATTDSMTEGVSYLRKSLKFFEEMLVSDSQNVHLKSDYARAIGWLGQALAADRNQSGEARQMLEKSFDLWTGMKSNGNVSQADFEQPEKMLVQISKLES